MQKINFDPLIERITWQDLRQYAPVPVARYFTYAWELGVILVAGVGMTTPNIPRALLTILWIVVSLCLLRIVHRYLHNRWRRHCVVRLKKFAQVNNFTYETEADWSGSTTALGNGLRQALIEPADTHIVSGTFAGHDFRLGLHKALLRSGTRYYPHRKPFLHIQLKRGRVPDSEKDYIAQESPVYIEYKGEYVHIYAPRWRYGTQNMVQEFPAFFAAAVDLIKEQKK